MNQETLKKRLHYNSSTGEFTYLEDVGRKMKKGDIAGGLKSNGYVQIRVAGKRYLAHRLAWLWMTGSFPDGYIDHINHNVADNSWSNLRLATASENQFNRFQKGKGVTFSAELQKWVARAVIEGKHIFLGAFTNYDDALSARHKFAEKAHGQFCCNT